MEIAHPFDSHPPLSERLKNIGYGPIYITAEKLKEQGGSSFELIENHIKIEQNLTRLYYQIMQSSGEAIVADDINDDEVERMEIFLDIIYKMAVAMIGVDGKIMFDEIRVAEGIGIKNFPGFDKVDFRNYIEPMLYDPELHIPDYKSVAEEIKGFEKDHLIAIYEYLGNIAAADEEVDINELYILDYLHTSWFGERDKYVEEAIDEYEKKPPLSETHEIHETDIDEFAGEEDDTIPF